MRDIRYQIAVDRKPDEELSRGASEIEVQQTIEGPTTFRIKFAIDICRGDFDYIDDARLNPSDKDTLITVTAYLNGEGQVLAHGVITERKLSLAEGGPGSSLEIVGQDRRVVMNRQLPPGGAATHEGRASDIASTILSRHGFEPDVDPTDFVYAEDKAAKKQNGTDLALLNELAGHTGFRFWIDWELAGGLTGFDVKETAHFKYSPPRASKGPSAAGLPKLLAPPGSAELKLNAAGGCSNVASFELHTNAETPNKSGPVNRVNEDDGQVTENVVTAPATEQLGGQPAAPRQPRERSLATAGGAEVARERVQAAVDDASWSVQATAETSVQALNAFVAPHQVIRVSGAGQLNSGDYFVKAVTHTVDSVAHKMRIEMLRNALGGS